MGFAFIHANGTTSALLGVQLGRGPGIPLLWMNHDHGYEAPLTGVSPHGSARPATGPRRARHAPDLGMAACTRIGWINDVDAVHL